MTLSRPGCRAAVNRRWLVSSKASVWLLAPSLGVRLGLSSGEVGGEAAPGGLIATLRTLEIYLVLALPVWAAIDRVHALEKPVRIAQPGAHGRPNLGARHLHDPAHVHAEQLAKAAIAQQVAPLRVGHQDAVVGRLQQRARQVGRGVRDDSPHRQPLGSRRASSLSIRLPSISTISKRHPW